MNRRTKIVKVIASVFAILAALSGLSILSYSSLRETPSGDLADIGSARDRLLAELEMQKHRRMPLRLARPQLEEADELDLVTFAENALTLQDLDGFIAAIADIEMRGRVLSDKLVQMKAAGSELFAERARKRRFDASQFKILSETGALRDDDEPAYSPQRDRAGILAEIRDILKLQYFADARHSISLNKDNVRALYDLARFYQERRTRFDDLMAIRYFERVESNMRGKMEKDADFLRTILNLAVLHGVRGNIQRSQCYAAETIEKYRARSDDDLAYLFGVDAEGKLNEPEFVQINSVVNPDGSSSHVECTKVN